MPQYCREVTFDIERLPTVALKRPNLVQSLRTYLDTINARLLPKNIPTQESVILV